LLKGLTASERAGNSPQALRFQATYYATLGFAMGDITLYKLADILFRRAQARLRAAPDPDTEAWLNFVYAVYLSGRGEWDSAIELLNESVRLSSETGSLLLWVEAHEYRGYALYLQSRYAEAMDSFEKSARVAIRDGYVQWMGRFHIAMSRLLMLQGKTEAAKAQYFEHEDQIKMALRTGNQRVHHIADNAFLTEYYMRCEQWDDALKSAQKLTHLLTVSQNISSVLAGTAGASIVLYLTLWEQGNAQYAKIAHDTLRIYRQRYRRNHEIGKPVEYTYRCWYHWLNHDEKRARQMGAMAIQAAENYKMPYFEALAHYHLGRFMSPDDPERATHLAHAHRLFEQIGAAYDADRVLKTISLIASDTV